MDKVVEVKSDVGIVEKVDILDRQIKESITGLRLIASLDHHRMEKLEDACTPQAIISIFSNPELNSRLLSIK